MRKLIIAVTASVLAFTSLAAGNTDDPPEGIDHMIEVLKDETQQVSAAGGTGGTNLMDDAECSSASYNATCEKTLAVMKAAGTMAVEVTPKYPSDYDLDIWLSDETGTLIEQVASSENFYNPVEPNEAAEFEAKAGEYYVLIVKYFAGGGGYFMNVGLS